jgi:hypothetical protein
MAFNVPIQQPLTGAQSEALGKLSSMNNLLTIPFKKFFDRPKSQQISLLDFLTKIADATLGAGYIDNLIMTFINDLFNKGSEKLVDAIIKGIAGALDAKPITIKQGMSNQDWLDQNVKQELNVAMELLKALIIKKIIILIYGPKDRIKPLKLPQNDYGNNPYLTQNYKDLTPEEYLDNAALSDVMFTTVNTVSNTYGDVEYNIVKLREQLEKGIVTFTVSCQDVKINLPESILQSADAVIDNNIKVFLQGQTVGGGPYTYQNPAGVLVELNGHIENETQRINGEENASAVKKSWIRILLDKLINLLPLVLYPILQKILDRINKEIQEQAAGATGSNVTPPANIPVNEQVGTGGGQTYTVITASMLTTIVPNTVQISFNNITVTDNGSGSLSGPGGITGRIDYNTGVGSITTPTAIPNGTAIVASYQKTPQDPFAVNIPLLTVENTLGLLTSVKNDIGKDRNLFDKNSVFYKIIMNGIYSLVLALILRKVLPKITKLITKALAKRKANQLARKFKRYQARAKLIQEQAQEIEKKAEAAVALKALKAVYDYLKIA